jgi:hypothetical protein
VNGWLIILALFVFAVASFWTGDLLDSLLNRQPERTLTDADVSDIADAMLAKAAAWGLTVDEWLDFMCWQEEMSG